MTKKGFSDVLVGLQWGDESKAKVADEVIGEDFHILARFNGGANAGHSLKLGDKQIALHQVPSGIFYPLMQLYIGSGCVVNPVKLVSEIEDINGIGINLHNPRRLFISGNVTLVQPHHLILDEIFGKDIGVTKNGIGPAYADQATRAEGKTLKNIRLAEYLSRTDLKEVVEENLAVVNFQHRYGLSLREIRSRVTLFDSRLSQLEVFLSEDPLFLEKAINKGKNVFFEGAQSVSLDSVTGPVPFVTSSRTLAAAAYTGGDLSISHHRKTIGVAKAIMSRVGNGPYISEYGGERSERYCHEGNGLAHVRENEFSQYDPRKMLMSDDPFEIGIGLRMIEEEYGASTKRPRRIGMLDLVMLRQNCLLNGVDAIYMNKIDSLRSFSQSSLPGIPLVTGYSLDGETMDYVPTTTADCRRVVPKVEYMPAFSEDISGVRKFSDLPKEARDVVRGIRDFVGVTVEGIGVGRDRSQLIKVE